MNFFCKSISQHLDCFQANLANVTFSGQALDLVQFLFSTAFVKFPLPAVQADHSIGHLPESAHPLPVRERLIKTKVAPSIFYHLLLFHLASHSRKLKFERYFVELPVPPQLGQVVREVVLLSLLLLHLLLSLL